MSRTSGIFSRITGSFVRRAAAIAGKAAFLAPLMRTLPTRGLPPRITNLSIRLSGAISPSLKSIRMVRLRETGFLNSGRGPGGNDPALPGLALGDLGTSFILYDPARLPAGRSP